MSLSTDDLLHTIRNDKGVRDIINTTLVTHGALADAWGNSSKQFVIDLNVTQGIAGIYLRNYFMYKQSAKNFWGNTELQTAHIADSNNNPNILNTEALFRLLSDEELPDLVEPIELTRERERRRVNKFTAEAKSLTLNMFAYKTFESFILSSKKMTGKDASRYMNLIPKRMYGSASTETLDTPIIRARYMKLIWDNVRTHSLELSTTIKYLIDNTVPDHEQPFKVFNTIPTKTPLNGWATQVTFNYEFLLQICRKLQIPNSIKALDISPSRTHDYITGVPKKNPMTFEDVKYAIETINILTYLNTLDKVNCPYYKMGIDQLVEECSKPTNIQKFKELVNIDRTMITAAERSLKTLTSIKESNEQNNNNDTGD